MALEKRIIDVPFLSGPDDKINPHLRQASDLSLMENCYQEKTGRVKSRGGLVALDKTTMESGSPDLDSLAGLYTFENELLAHTDTGDYGDSLYTWSSSNERWSRLGDLAQANLSSRNLYQANDYAQSFDMDGYSSGGGEWACYAMSGVVPTGSNASTRFVIVDLVTDSIIFDYTLGSPTTGSLVGVAAVSGQNSFVCCYQRDSSADIRCFVVSNVNTTPTLGSETVLVSGIYNTTVSRFRVLAVPSSFDNNSWILAYRRLTGTLTFTEYNTSKVAGNTREIGGANPKTSHQVTWEPTNNRVGVVFHENGFTMAAALAGNLSSTVWGPFQVQAHTDSLFERFAGICPDAVSGKLRVFWTEYHSNTNESSIYTAQISSIGGVDYSGVCVHGAILASAPFTARSSNYFWAVRPSPSDELPKRINGLGTLILLKADDTGPTHDKRKTIARALVNQVSMGNVTDPTPTFTQRMLEPVSVYQRSNGGIDGVFPKGKSIITGEVYFTTMVVLTCDLSASSMPTVRVNETLVIGAGVLKVYDRASVLQAGLEMRHPNFYLESSPTGGSMVDGTYGFAVVYRWYDFAGNAYYSAPTFNTISLGGGTSTQKVIIERSADTQDWLIHNRITDKIQSSVGAFDPALMIYRTLSNGSVYHYCDSAPLNNEISNLSNNDNEFGLGDSDVSKNPVLYTTGGVVNSVLPPTPHHLSSDGETAVIVPGDDREEIWVSAPITSGVGVRFSDSLVYRVPEGGDIECTGWMDGRLIVFKGTQIRYMIGTPPNALGQNGFSGSRLITNDIGCDEWRSLVRVPSGFVFKSRKGFYLLDRSLQVQYVGSKVESYNSETVLSATLMENINQVRFSMDSGDVIVWDYFHNNWPVFPSMDFVTTAYWDNSWVGGKTDATVVQEDLTKGKDFTTTQFTYKIRTGWLTLAALQGYQRVRRLNFLGYAPDGNGNIRNDITLRAYHDFDDVTAVETLFTNTIFGNVQGIPFRQRIHIPTQKMTSIMIEIEGKYSTGETNRPNLTWTGVSFEAGAKRGSPKLSTSESS